VESDGEDSVRMAMTLSLAPPRTGAPSLTSPWSSCHGRVGVGYEESTWMALSRSPVPPNRCAESDLALAVVQ